MPGRKGSTPQMDDNESPFSFTYEEFEDWYEAYRRTHLEPARATFVRLLNEQLDDVLTDFDRRRIRLSGSRVKSPARLWAKMQREQYRDHLSEVQDAVTAIDDLVGVRVTCNNLSDIEFLQGVLSGLPFLDDSPHASLSVESESEKVYVRSPKESGYRAYHINLVTVVPALGGLDYVRGELQVRTLLQDGWGELTHEDTYKPGVPLPPLAVRLARRMADLLATVDDLAQDLRNELDRISREDFGDTATTPPPEDDHGHFVATPDSIPPVVELYQPTIQATELQAEARRVVLSLTKATSLAAVAQQVQAAFGTKVSGSWGGHGSFKELLKRAVPEASIVGVSPGMVVPPGVAPPTETREGPAESSPEEEGVPAVVLRLKALDKNVPALAPTRMQSAIRSLLSVLDESTWNDLDIDVSHPGIKDLNRLTKRARDLASDDGVALPRHGLNWLLRGLLFTGNLRPNLTFSDVTTCLAAFVFARAASLNLTDDPSAERAEIEAWMGIDPVQPSAARRTRAARAKK